MICLEMQEFLNLFKTISRIEELSKVNLTILILAEMNELTNQIWLIKIEIDYKKEQYVCRRNIYMFLIKLWIMTFILSAKKFPKSFLIPFFFKIINKISFKMLI